MQRKSIKSLAVFVTVLSLAVMLGAQTAFASNRGPNTPLQRTYAHAGAAVAGPLVSQGNTYCPVFKTYNTCDGYDVKMSNCGFIDGSHGAYWVGNYPGDYSWLQVWWAPACQSNFIYVNASAAGNVCNGQRCAYVDEVIFSRTEEINECTSPGNCNHASTFLGYCAGLSVCTSTFNGEWIGTNTWWPSFVTDMLYAPNQAVQACAILVDASGSNATYFCSKWH